MSIIRTFAVLLGLRSLQHWNLIFLPRPPPSRINMNNPNSTESVSDKWVDGGRPLPRSSNLLPYKKELYCLPVLNFPPCHYPRFWAILYLVSFIFRNNCCILTLRFCMCHGILTKYFVFSLNLSECISLNLWFAEITILRILIDHGHNHIYILAIAHSFRRQWKMKKLRLPFSKSISAETSYK